MREVTVTSGCTEAIASAMLGLLDPGDEVVLFEPFFDCYRAAILMAGGRPRCVPLYPPEQPDEPFWFDEGELRAAFGPKTRVVLVNTPHNPTGKVFTRDELGLIGALAREHGAAIVSDEVYERLVYEGQQHLPTAAVDGLAERTLTCSSLGKSFSCTGWKVGWAVGPATLTDRLRIAHQYLVFATNTPAQHAAARALALDGTWNAAQNRAYQRRRDTLVAGLRALGMRTFKPASSYFVLAEHDALGFADDVACCEAMVSEARVAAIPPTAFYATPELGRGMIRLAFCKPDATVAAALERLNAWGRSR